MRFIRIILGSLAIGLVAMWLGVGFAHADTIGLGGHWDGNCAGLNDGLVTTGQAPVDHCAVYSAQMAPLGNDTISTNDSTNEGAAVAVSQCRVIPGHCTYVGFSEGTFAAAKAQNQSATMGLDSSVVLYGDAVGSTNILNSWDVNLPFVQQIVENPAAPFSFNPDGIPVVPEPPNTTRFFSQNDPFANGKQLIPWTPAIQAVDPNGHRITGLNEPNLVTWNGPNGEVNHEADVGSHPFTEALRDNNGIDAGPVGNAFFNTVFPVESNVPRSALPSFFGEAPCVAADGSQYFTPGEASC